MIRTSTTCHYLGRFPPFGSQSCVLYNARLVGHIRMTNSSRSIGYNVKCNKGFVTALARKVTWSLQPHALSYVGHSTWSSILFKVSVPVLSEQSMFMPANAGDAELHGEGANRGSCTQNQSFTIRDRLVAHYCLQRRSRTYRPSLQLRPAWRRLLPWLQARATPEP